jgi:hypothetical protein
VRLLELNLDGTRYKTNVIVQNSNNSTVVEAANALFNKHPDTSIIVKSQHQYPFDEVFAILVYRIGYRHYHAKRRHLPSGLRIRP